MIVVFTKEYLRDLYTKGVCTHKKYRFQPEIVSKYIRVIALMLSQENVLGLMKYGSLHYEHLHGDKEDLSSVRVNDQYRIEFSQQIEDGKTIATIVNIEELSKHYE